MQGTRKYPNDEGRLALAAGEYGIDPTDGKWYCRVPDPEIPMGSLAGHDVTEHEDGTITVSPSILIEYGDVKSWHGFLERGVWREV